MHPGGTEDMFESFTYEKPSVEIKEKAKAKIADLEDKIKDREARVARIRQEYGITDQALVDILTQARSAQRDNRTSFTYKTSLGNGVTTAQTAQGPEERTIAAGTINNLLTENDFIEAERKQVKRLQLIVRNLKDLPDPNVRVVSPGETRPLRGPSLREDELEYLGF